MLLWKIPSAVCNIVKNKTYDHFYIYIAKSDTLQNTNKESLFFSLRTLFFDLGEKQNIFSRPMQYNFFSYSLKTRIL